MTLHHDLGRPDDHNNPSLLAGLRGGLFAFWAPHSGRYFPVRADKRARIYYRRQRVPGTLSFSPIRSIPRPKHCRLGYTYPNPMWVNGQLYLFIRGCTWQPTLITLDKRGWARRGQVIVQGAWRQRPYAKYDTDGTRVFMAFTECHVSSCEHNSVFFARYANGSWNRADGTRIAKRSELPFRPRDAGPPIYDAAIAGGRAWIQDVAFSPEGAPVVLYTVEPQGKDFSSYWYAVYKNGAWKRHIIPVGVTLTDAPAGATLDHETPNVAYVSRRVGVRNQVSIVTTDDDGASWSERRLTSSSDFSSIRPVSPRNDPGNSVLWVWGRRSDYRRFKTQIRYAPISDASVFRSSMKRLRPSGG